MLNASLKKLIARRTQLLDELWELDKELTRLEAIERDAAAAARGSRARRKCAACRKTRDCRLIDDNWLCSRCRGIERSKAFDARERPTASQTEAG